MKSIVYFTPVSRRESPRVIAEKTGAIFRSLRVEHRLKERDLVAVKIHFGEKGTTGYIKPEWLSEIIEDLISKRTKAFLTDTNTLYIGNRSNSADHLKLAMEHGYSLEKLGIPVIIGDGLIGRDDEELAVDTPRLKSLKIAGTFVNTDALLCLSHFTGHILTGFGSAIKNLGMGCASRAGKLEQHSDVHPWVSEKTCTGCGECLSYCPTGALIDREGKAFIQDEECIGCGECLVVCSTGAVKMQWDGDNLRVQEKMAEYAKGVAGLFGEKIGFMNFLLQITKDCDCMSKNGTLIAEDIGILGSHDPVALDRASADLLLEKNGVDVIRKSNDVDWTVQLSHAEKIGLGTQEYTLEILS